MMMDVSWSQETLTSLLHDDTEWLNIPELVRILFRKVSITLEEQQRFSHSIRNDQDEVRTAIVQWSKFSQNSEEVLKELVMKEIKSAVSTCVTHKHLKVLIDSHERQQDEMKQLRERLGDALASIVSAESTHTVTSERFDSKLREATTNLTRQITDNHKFLSEMRVQVDSCDGRVETSEQLVHKMSNEVQELRETVAHLKGLVTTQAAHREEFLNFQRVVMESQKEQASKLHSFSKDVRVEMSSWSNRLTSLDNIVDSHTATITAAASLEQRMPDFMREMEEQRRTFAKSQTAVDSLKRDTQAALEGMDQRYVDQAVSMSALQEDVKRSIADTTKELQRSVDQKVQSLQSDLKRFDERITNEISTNIEHCASSIQKDVRHSLDELKASQESSAAQVNKDLQQMATTHKQQVEAVTSEQRRALDTAVSTQQREFGNSLAEMRREVESSSNEQFRQVQANMAEQKRHTEASLAEQKQALKVAVQETTEQCAEKLTSAKKELQETISAVEGKVSAVKKDTHDAITSVEEKVSNVKKELHDTTEMVEEKLTVVKKEIHESVEVVEDKMASVKKEMNERVEMAEGKVTAAKKDIHDAVTAVEEKVSVVKKGLHEATESVDDKVSAMKKDMQENLGAVDSKVANMKKDVQESVSASEEKMAAKALTAEAMILQKTAEAVKQAQQTLRDKTEHSINRATTQHRQALEEQAADILQQTKQHTQRTINTAVDDAKNEMNTQLKHVEDDMKDSVSATARKAQESIEEASTKIMAKCNDHTQKALQEQEATITQSCRQLVEEAESVCLQEVAKKTDEVRQETTSTISQAAHQEEQRSTELQSMRREINSIEETLQSSMDSTIAKFEQQLHTVELEHRSSVERTSTATRTLLEEIERRVVESTGSTQEQLVSLRTEMNAFVDARIATLTSSFETVRESANESSLQAYNCRNELRAESEHLRTTIDELSDNVIKKALLPSSAAVEEMRELASRVQLIEADLQSQKELHQADAEMIHTEGGGKKGGGNGAIIDSDEFTQTFKKYFEESSLSMRSDIMNVSEKIAKLDSLIQDLLMLKVEKMSTTECLQRLQEFYTRHEVEELLGKKPSHESMCDRLASKPDRMEVRRLVEQLEGDLTTGLKAQLETDLFELRQRLDDVVTKDQLHVMLGHRTSSAATPPKQ